MPIVQTAIISALPEHLRGRTAPITSGAVRPTCAAEEIPALAAEGIAGPVRILHTSAEGTRRHPDGSPMLWRITFCCVSADGELPGGTL